MKFVMIDEQLEELWIRKGLDESVYIFRVATAIELYKELSKLHHLEDCDVIILSAGSNDIDISWQEQHGMKNDTDREIAHRAAIRDIAEDIVREWPPGGCWLPAKENELSLISSYLPFVDGTYDCSGISDMWSSQC